MIMGKSKNIGVWDEGCGWEWQELFMESPFLALS